jgi:hypothetical protein
VLVWEAACRWPASESFATGDAWDDACVRAPAACASGFGVRGMGAMREWTGSDVVPRKTFASLVPAVRGGGILPTGPAPAGSRRCAARTRVLEGRAEADLGFRCCYGSKNEATVPGIEPRPAFRPTEMTAADVGRIFADLPELGKLGTDVALFDDTKVEGSRERALFTSAPLTWSPELGVEVLVAAGHTHMGSFVAALYPLGGEKYRVASYFLMLGETSPLALVYDPHHRTELFWTSCWGCSGEQGSVRIKPDHKVVVVQN